MRALRHYMVAAAASFGIGLLLGITVGGIIEAIDREICDDDHSTINVYPDMA